MLSVLIITFFVLVLVSGTKCICFFPKAILLNDPMDQKSHHLLRKFVFTNYDVLLSLLMLMVSEMEYLHFISKAKCLGRGNELCKLHSQDHVTDGSLGSIDKKRKHSAFNN